MRAIRDNLAFILLGIFAVILVFFMLRLQNLIMTTQQTEPTAAANTPETVEQQPTVLVASTATNTPEPPGDQPAANDGSYQVYGSLVVGAIHLGSTTDYGYNQANAVGLQQMVEQVPNVRLITAENVPETEAVFPVIDDMVSRGAQLIFTQSFGYLPYALQAGEKYPNVTFVNSGGFELSENVGTYLANHVELVYLTGMVAGATTQTNQLGFVIGPQMPSTMASVNAFELGARSVNPNATTHVVTTGSWVDPAAEKLATEALASIGADVVAMIVDSPTTIVETAAERGIYVIGFHSGSLQQLAPNNWLTGVEHTWGNYFTQVAQQVRSGQWQSGHVRGGIESDMLRLAPFGPAVSAETRSQVLIARTDLISGRVNIFQGPIVDSQGVERVAAGAVGEVELLDNTDWFVEGVVSVDPATVEILPPPANPVVSAAPAPETATSNSQTTVQSGYSVYGSEVIGAIHVGSVDDRGYNQAHNEGLQQMIERIPDVRLIDAENVPETEEVLGIIDQMIQQGAKIIFAQSFGYLPYVVQAAEEHPDVTFLHPGGFELRPNLGTYWANNYEAMYLAGIAAGANTATNELGFITAFPIPNILASVNAFHLGARSVNPDVNTHLVITESWVDPEKEAQAVNALAASGVDVVTMIVDSPTEVVITAEALGMFTIGFHSDALQELAPNRWLTGVAYTWGNYYTSVVQQIRAGQWQASHVRGGIESDMLQIAPFGPSVSEETRNRIISARTDIIRGQRQIFQGPIVDNQGLERIPADRAGGLELLDTTDWLVEGVAELDAEAVDVEAIPVLPTPTQSTASDTPTEVDTPTEAPTATPTPIPASSNADLILGDTDHHPECTFFSELTAQIIREQFALDVEVVDFVEDDIMYEELANRQNQRTVDLTVCYGDPDDRPYLREYFGFLKHIGDVYWEGPEIRLQVLTNAGFSAELERNQTCLYRFLKNLHFEGEELLSQTPAEWIAANQATVPEWASCELNQ